MKLSSTYIRLRNRRRLGSDNSSAKDILLNFENFEEAVVNLFMKLQASNLTKLDNLGVKLKIIDV